MINEKNSSEENYFPARSRQTLAIKILNIISPPTTERNMPRPIGKPNSYKNGESGIPVHPQIWDSRTVAQVLHEVDHPELYEDMQDGTPVPPAPARHPL